MGRRENPAPATQRQRVRDHMKRLLKATAIAGAALGADACRCGNPLVCDPMPAPVCGTHETASRLIASGHLTTQAKWTGSDVSVSLGLRSFGREKLTFAAAPTTHDGAISAVSPVGTGELDFTLAPRGTTLATVVVPIDCNGRPVVLELTVDVAAPDPGKPVTINGLDR